MMSHLDQNANFRALNMCQPRPVNIFNGTLIGTCTVAVSLARIIKSIIHSWYRGVDHVSVAPLLAAVLEFKT